MNFVPGVTTALYQDEYRQGAGGELNWETRNGKKRPPKMAAAYSSSAVVVNAFAPWKLHLKEFELGGFRGFRSLRFEAQVPTGLGGTPPHLDFLAESTGNGVIGAESKLTEYLRPHRDEFVSSYTSKAWPDCVETYGALMRFITKNPSAFLYLNAGQLIKHAFGLASMSGGHDQTLLYLYWEPENSDSYREFDLHHREVEYFSKSVAGSSVKFSCKSYLDLIHEWVRSDEFWLKRHASELLRRYAVRI